MSKWCEKQSHSPELSWSGKLKDGTESLPDWEGVPDSGLLHLSCSAFGGFAHGSVLAQSGENATSAEQSSQIGWKRDNFDSWKIPSTCMYCVCRERESPLVQQETLWRVSKVLMRPK